VSCRPRLVSRFCGGVAGLCAHWGTFCVADGRVCSCWVGIGWIGAIEGRIPDLLLILHATWTDGAVHLWGEKPDLFARGGRVSADESASGGVDPVDEVGSGVDSSAGGHPFAADVEELRGALSAAGIVVGDEVASGACAKLALPVQGGLPTPSPSAAHRAGFEVPDAEPVFGEFTVPSLRLEAGASWVIERLEQVGAADARPQVVIAGDSLTYFAAVVRFVRYLRAQQRLVPALAQGPAGDVYGLWQPWLADQSTMDRLPKLVSAMPGAARAGVDSHHHHAWPVLEEALTAFTDAACRAELERESMTEAIEGRDPDADPHVGWLVGLLGEGDDVRFPMSDRPRLVGRVRWWISRLEERGLGTQWRLMLRLSEPMDIAGLSDFQAPGDSVRWPMTLHLQSAQNPQVVVDARDIWLLPAGSATVSGLRLDDPQGVLLAELGRAARLYDKIDRALHQENPSQVDLKTSEAYGFLREIRPVLIEQGVGVEAPAWWDSPTVRLGARMRIESPPLDELEGDSGGASPTAATRRLGLNSLVDYTWQIAVGDSLLTMDQFEQLANQRAPLVLVNGRWVEVRAEDVRAAMRFIRENPGGQMEVGRALRLAYGSDPAETGLHITGMDATGWVDAVFGTGKENDKLPQIESPLGFIGELRPYQLKGLSWLAFLDRFGLGSCLADDMGLGKTVQLLALLAHERAALPAGAPAEPTLIVAPMSVVANWTREAARFAPGLRVLVHHGPERLVGDELVARASESDLVVTTYALVNRDAEVLAKVNWLRVALDEAQNVKNPSAKQTQAVLSLNAPRRVALTGTPVENRLTELWSIMEFLNPGYLGTGNSFRRRYAVPIERYHDSVRAGQLRGLVRPFVLRRLKTDPTVIADLPEKVESKEYCYLTPEQAKLYEKVVADMLSAADTTEGIQRRGVVLAGLIRLKQVCNHPAQMLREADLADAEEGVSQAASTFVADPARSGKCLRLLQMLDEVISEGDRALVFTQFRQMGRLLAGMLRQELDCETLFMHGGSTATQRQEMIDRFQDLNSRAKVFILSLKAGGVGLNLTAANHVFHFDRWWNPAVEAQATDRAYRIGQTRTVQVHKFVVAGTLEERIDQMLEEKTRLAQEVIGAGEDWLTELDTQQLRDLLTLRSDAVLDD